MRSNGISAESSVCQPNGLPALILYCSLTGATTVYLSWKVQSINTCIVFTGHNSLSFSGMISLLLLIIGLVRF